MQLAACYRIFAHLGWTEMIYNHITLRVPGREKHLLINPFGLHYTEITASNLVKIDLDGNILSDSRWPINPAGMAPHATVTATPSKSALASCTRTPPRVWRWPAPGAGCR